MTETIPVFYCQEMIAESLSFSPSSTKPIKVMKEWQKMGIPLDVRSVEPISREDLYLAHQKEFIDGVLDGHITNGFDNDSPEVATSVLYTNASIRDAAAEAITNKVLAVSPTSGFHHAHYGAASAYCTFNGLMVAAMYCLKHGLTSSVGILDCDYHYGNGTSNIIGKVSDSNKILHYTTALEFYKPEHAEDFLKALESKVEWMRHCGVILYQAGADPHIHDPLGGFLTNEQMYQRDKIVFEACKKYSVPVVWNLAGGYQKTEEGESDWEALCNIHANTLGACAEVYLDAEYECRLESRPVDNVSSEMTDLEREFLLDFVGKSHLNNALELDAKSDGGFNGE